jgi:hypothetical protein
MPEPVAPVRVPLPMGWTGQVLTVCGSRYWRMPYFLTVRDYLRRVAAARGTDGILVLTGGAPGVDTIADKYAGLIGFRTHVLPAQWERPDGSTDKLAGFTRNTLLVEHADRVVAFWNGESRGTLDTIRKARAAGKLHAVYGLKGQTLEVE